MTNRETLIALGTVLFIFAWIGFRRGLRAELGTLLLILGSRMLIERRGDWLIALINSLYRGLLFFLKGGLTSDEPGRVFAAVRSARPLISREIAPTLQLVLFVLSILAAYTVLNRLRLFQGASSLLGALLGAINGYLIIVFFLPLLPRDLPEPLEFLSEILPIAGRPEIQAAMRPLRALIDDYQSFVMVGVIGLLLFLVVRTIQPQGR